MKQHRALYRLPIDRTGELSRQDQTAVCRIVDLTSEGIRLETALAVQPGELLRLSFCLVPNRPLHCDLQVVTARSPYVGGRLVNFSPEDRQALNAFIEDFLDLNFMGM